MAKSPSTSSRFFTWMFIITKLTKLAKLAKFAKLAKPLITVVTMSISAVAYAFWLGPWFAIGLVIMLFIHEMGHVIALRMRGYEASAPVFIPFLGAVIFGPRMTNRDDEAFVGIGGPVLGGLAAAIVLGVWWFIEDKTSDLAIILLMISYVGMFLNVFNLMPIRPLDGGRITQAVGPWFKYVGVATLGLFSVFFREPVVLFIWILIMPEVTILPARLRAGIASVMWVAMVALMLLGYSTQPYWVDIIDAVFAAFLVMVMIFQVQAGEDMAEEDNQRPQLSKELRVAWFVRFVLLTAVLVGLMAYQIMNLPAVTN